MTSFSLRLLPKTPLNICAPNKCAEQRDLFETISEEFKSSLTLADFSVVVGGDFNVYLRPRLRRERRYQEDERLGVLELFGECSGLKVNDKKTEILALGNNFLQKTNFPKHNVCEVIKILGIYFCYDERQRDNLNF